MPLVILEGPDGSGKTSLASRLLKGTGHSTLLIRRSGPPTPIETLEFQAQWIAKQSMSGLNIIADRHPIISEAIYRPVVRQEGNAPWSLDEVVREIDGADLLLIYCRPSFARMNEARKVEEQMAGVADHFVKLVQMYDRWIDAFRANSVDIYIHDFERDPSSYEAIKVVKSYWERGRG